MWWKCSTNTKSELATFGDGYLAIYSGAVGDDDGADFNGLL